MHQSHLSTGEPPKSVYKASPFYYFWSHMMNTAYT